MPRVEDSLALAASSNAHSSEKRLSAIFGTVLQAHAGFANLLLSKLALPSVYEPAVSTEEPLGADGQLDLVLRGVAQHGRGVVVYFENKRPGSRKWEPGQPWKYLNSLSDETTGAAEGKLLALVGEPRDVRDRVRNRIGSASRVRDAAETVAELRADASHPSLSYATWQQVAGWALEAGERTHGSTWLDRAAEPTTRADERLLAELIWYLEGEGYAMARGLTDEQIRLARDAFHLSELLESLTTDVSKRVGAAGLGLTAIKGTLDFRPPTHSWLPNDARLYMYFYPPGTHREIDLAFYVDVFVASQANVLKRNQTWKARVAKNRLEFDGESIIARYDAKMLLSRSSLSEQGATLAKWAVERIRRILELQPERPL